MRPAAWSTLKLPRRLIRTTRSKAGGESGETVEIGDEAVVHPSTFSLEGRPIRKVRQSVHRLQAAGYSAAVLRPGELDGALRRALEALGIIS